MAEIWKEIPDFPSYEASSLGKIRNKRTKRLKEFQTNKDGYQTVTLTSFANGKKHHNKTVHHIIAETFLGGKHPDLQVDHKFGVKTDNRVEMLEWVTGSENVKRAYKLGIRKPSGGRGPIRRIRIVETGDVYENCRECGDAIGVDPSNISRCLHGQIKTVKNLHLEYYNDSVEKDHVLI